MTTTIAAMLKNDQGALLPYTGQSTMSQCEEWCEANLLAFDRLKERGAKVVQVEVQEISPNAPAPAADIPVEAAQRVTQYLHERLRAHQLDKEEITSMNVGSDREARLLVDDLQLLSAYILGQGRSN